MKLSRILSVALLGAVAMTSSAMAAGTTAGTTITNQPTLNYSMGDSVIKDAKVESASYVVDKLINFKINLNKEQKQNVAVGKKVLGEFLLTNIGNSKENFVLAGDYGSLRDFEFLSSKIYIDANNNGVLDKAEMEHTPVLEKLAIDAKKIIWIEAVTNEKEKLKKGNHFGLLAQASSKGAKEIYKQSTKNNLSEVDVVFNDGQGGGDKLRDNRVINRYIWTTVQGGDVKLDIVADYNLITADPINGACKNHSDAMSGRFKAIPGATSLKSWRITNKTKTVAKNVVFKIKIDASTEKIAKDGSNIWNHGDIKDIKKHSLFVTSEHKLLSLGKFDGRDTVTYTIPEIKPGGYARPFIVTEIK